MPSYGIPGVNMDRRRSRRAGVLALSVATVVATALWFDSTDAPAAHRLRVQVQTEEIGDGVGGATPVQLDGVAVGEVGDITGKGDGTQLLTLELDPNKVTGLTDSLTLDYAPSNLFGITAVALRRALGGRPLRDGMVVDLTGVHRARVADTTLGVMLRSLTDTSTKTLTPELTDLLTKVDVDLSGFAPLLQAMVMVSGSIADTQRYASSLLVDQYASLLNGAGQVTSSTFTLLANLLNIEVLVNSRPLFDAGVDMLSNQSLPGVGVLLNTLRDQGHFAGLTNAATPLMAATAAMVPTPALSHAQLTELLARLDHLFADSPGGPTLNVAVALQRVPGLAVPLLGQQQLTQLGRQQLTQRATTPGNGGR